MLLDVLGVHMLAVPLVCHEIEVGSCLQRYQGSGIGMAYAISQLAVCDSEVIVVIVHDDGTETRHIFIGRDRFYDKSLWLSKHIGVA